MKQELVQVSQMDKDYLLILRENVRAFIKRVAVQYINRLGETSYCPLQLKQSASWFMHL